MLDRRYSSAMRRVNSRLMWRRMLHAGVRVGFLDQVVADYYPSYRQAPDDFDR